MFHVKHLVRGVYEKLTFVDTNAGFSVRRYSSICMAYIATILTLYSIRKYRMHTTSKPRFGCGMGSILVVVPRQVYQVGVPVLDTLRSILWLIQPWK